MDQLTHNVQVELDKHHSTVPGQTKSTTAKQWLV